MNTDKLNSFGLTIVGSTALETRIPFSTAGQWS
jgi:hypothetical protein